MTQHKVWIAAACSWLAAELACAEPGPRLADVAARVDYGFYARDAAVIEAAQNELEGPAAGDPWHEYVQAYAAMRLAQLRPGRGRETGRLLQACVEHAESAAGADPVAIEAWLLVAGCSALAAAQEPMKGPLHQRRVEQALGRARDIDAAHPRIALVETWRMSGDDSPNGSAASPAVLEEAVQAFAQWPQRYAAPAWGEAEARAALGAAYLARGDARRARDQLEQALMAAPDYRDVLDLLARVQTR
jgi:tetratricopeptide (TPR) repeat protein